MALDIDFAFEGFRILKRKPLLIPIWGLVFLLGLVVGLGGLFGLGYPAFQRLTQMGSTPDPTAMMTIMPMLIGPYLILFIAMILSQSVVQCAIFRAALEEPQTTFGYLKLGGDEGRNILVNLVFAIVFMGIYLGVFLACGAVTWVLVTLLTLINKNLAGLGVFVGVLAGICSMFWIMVRLSLHSVQSFEKKRFDLFGSWSLTAGKTWTLLGGYLIAAILAIVIEIVGFIILAIVVGILAFLGASAVKNAGSGNPADVMKMVAAMAPAMIVYILGIGLVILPLMLTVMLSPAAAAYKQLAGVGKAKIENLF